MACQFDGRKDLFENFVLTDLSNLNGKSVKLTDDLRTGLGYDNPSIRAIGQSLLQLSSEHDCTVTFPGPDDYDTCNTVGDLADLLYGHL
jgi:hypothetical protein